MQTEMDWPYPEIARVMPLLEQRKKIEQARIALHAFDWEHTDQGVLYWIEVQKNLAVIRNRLTREIHDAIPAGHHNKYRPVFDASAEARPSFERAR